jgi:hypothetical protein
MSAQVEGNRRSFRIRRLDSWTAELAKARFKLSSLIKLDIRILSIVWYLEVNRTDLAIR